MQREKIEAFEEAYSSSGAWAALFRRSTSYHGTQLLRDAALAGCYLAIDRWESRELYNRFKQQYAADYALLDTECEKLTASEKMLGVFEEM